MQHPRPRALGAVRRQPCSARDPVGDLEADPEHARQLIRALADYPVRGRAVLGVDPADEIGEGMGGCRITRSASPDAAASATLPLRTPAAVNAARGSVSIASSTPAGP